ncbi:MAG TPA: hypothetical protein VD833_06430 [Vicinamibacterales bacterium]|nr:hypothetical protein [Vicinamibacterales bacterium]
MRQHLHLLHILHLVWGGIGLLLGASTLLLAGAAVAIGAASQTKGWSALATAMAFAACGLVLLAGGAANAWAGRALRRRRPLGRLVALGLAVPNLFVLPFGTALGVYSLWVLLHDETRREFLATGEGRPPDEGPYSKPGRTTLGPASGWQPGRRG